MNRQTVLITGANQGLGFATAQLLSQQPNYVILLGSRDATKGEEAVRKINGAKPQSQVYLLVLDVTSDHSIEAAKSEVVNKYGDKLDVLVNNAGIAPPEDTLKGGSPRELMQRTYDVNVFGAAAMTEAFLPLLENAPFPRIVNVSSGLGSIGSVLDPNWRFAGINLIAYNTSKSALNALTAYYTNVLKKARVVSLCPGYNATNLSNYRGLDPTDGCRIILQAITEEESSVLKTGQYWREGEQIPW